jgi:hypothetical protein
MTETWRRWYRAYVESPNWKALSMTEPVTMTEAQINAIVTQLEALMDLSRLQIRRGDVAGTLATLERVEKLALRLPRKRDA